MYVLYTDPHEGQFALCADPAIYHLLPVYTQYPLDDFRQWYDRWRRNSTSDATIEPCLIKWQTTHMQQFWLRTVIISHPDRPDTAAYRISPPISYSALVADWEALSAEELNDPTLFYQLTGDCVPELAQVPGNEAAFVDNSVNLNINGEQVVVPLL